jgi:hypothetical protein
MITSQPDIQSQSANSSSIVHPYQIVQSYHPHMTSSTKQTSYEFPTTLKQKIDAVEVSQELRKIEILTQMCDFNYDNKDAVIQFIDDNSENILPVLHTSREIINRLFGANISLSLNLFEDPEEGTKMLNVFIVNDLSPDEALQKEEKIYEDWFLKCYPELTNLLNFREVPL